MIVFQNNVLSEFDDLIFTLCEKDYFSTLEAAENYVDTILDFIYANIETFPSKNSPLKLKHFGRKYIFYKSNKRTTWFVFYESRDSNYLITKIVNNHAAEANLLHSDG